MHQKCKQIGIYATLAFCYLPYTMISTFYPGIADSKGVPTWLTGLIYSSDPLAGLLSSLLTSKYMFKVGRKRVILLSLLEMSLSILFLSPIQFLDKNSFFSLSLLSRILSGFSIGSGVTAICSIFVSDYPKSLSQMIGRMEGVIGFSLISGPLLGILLTQAPLFLSLLSYSLLTILFIPICSRALGTFRSYNFQSNPPSAISLTFKPKILLDLIMNFILMFSFGFMMPTLELHLLSFNLSPTYVSLAFIMYSLSNCIIAIAGPPLFKALDERIVIIIGINLMSLGYLMIAPWGIVFDRSLGIVLGALPLIGVGEALIYLPTFGHMVKCASNFYGFENDDGLSDALSGITSVFWNLGGVTGPIISGCLIEYTGYEYTAVWLALCYFIYGLVFLTMSGVLTICRSQNRIRPQQSLHTLQSETFR